MRMREQVLYLLANFLLNGLLQMLSINNGPNFTSRIRSPIRSNNFNSWFTSVNFVVIIKFGWKRSLNSFYFVDIICIIIIVIVIIFIIIYTCIVVVKGRRWWCWWWVIRWWWFTLLHHRWSIVSGKCFTSRWIRWSVFAKHPLDYCFVFVDVRVDEKPAERRGHTINR